MKRFRLVSCLLLILLIVQPVLTSCSVGGTVKDDFGFERPKDAWITECLLLPKEPVSDEEIAELGDIYTANQGDFIKYEELWGESGENGLASEAAVAMDGQTNEKGQCWLVYLIYADAGIPYFSEETVAKTSHSVVYLDNESLTVRDSIGGMQAEKYFGGLDGEWGTDFGWAVWYEGENDVLQGAIAFPLSLGVFKAPENGTLYAEISVRGTGASNEKLDDGDVFRFMEGQPDTTVEVGGFSVRYLPWDAYRYGDYADDELVDTLTFENGAGAYAVVDITLTAKQDNDGTHKVNVLTSISSAMSVAINIEEAPTGQIEQAIIGRPDRSDYEGVLNASYTAPSKAGESKTVRMVIRLIPAVGGECALDFFAVGDSRTEMAGASHVREVFHTGDPVLGYDLNEDRSAYVVAMLTNTKATTVIIPDVLGDGLPVVGFDEKLFYDNRTITHIVIGKNVKLPENAFWGCLSLQSITFNGTKREWEELEKHWSWAGGLQLKQIICSDGTVDLK